MPRVPAAPLRSAVPLSSDFLRLPVVPLRSPLPVFPVVPLPLILPPLPRSPLLRFLFPFVLRFPPQPPPRVVPPRRMPILPGRALRIHRLRRNPHHPRLIRPHTRPRPPLVRIPPSIIHTPMRGRIHQRQIRQIRTPTSSPINQMMHMTPRRRRRRRRRRTHPLLPQQRQILRHRPTTIRPAQEQRLMLEPQHLEKQIPRITLLNRRPHRHLHIGIRRRHPRHRRHLLQRGHHNHRRRPPRRLQPSTPMRPITRPRSALRARWMIRKVRINPRTEIRIHQRHRPHNTVTAHIAPGVPLRLQLRVRFGCGPRVDTGIRPRLGLGLGLGFGDSVNVRVRLTGPPPITGRPHTTTKPSRQRRLHRIMQPLRRIPIIDDTISQQIPRPRMISSQPLDQRRQMRRQPPRNPTHPIMALRTHPHPTSPLAISIGIRIIDAQQRPQHRSQRIQIINIDMLDQLRDMRIRRRSQLCMHMGGKTPQYPVNLLHRIGTNDTGGDFVPHARHEPLIALDTQPLIIRLQPPHHRTPPPGLGLADPLALGQRRRQPRIRTPQVLIAGLDILRIDDRQLLARPLQLQVGVLTLIARQPLPPTAGHLHRPRQIRNRRKQIRGAPRWTGHDPTITRAPLPRHPKSLIFSRRRPPWAATGDTQAK